jgi:conserved oligomeric Golgi complex subunit 5
LISDFFQHFLSDQKNDHQLNTTLTITDQIKKLSAGLDAISSELQTQVRQQHGALLSQASHAGKLTAALDSVEGSVKQLKIGADRLKSQIPYNLLENQTKILIRLHETSNLLRQSGRFLAVHKRLEASANLADQATLLYELGKWLTTATLLTVIMCSVRFFRKPS